MKRNPFFEHVEPFIKAGQLWRAKESLQGSIGTSSYHQHPELYEAYGRVLLQMGDSVEAGKYLFLSGRREAEYAEAIELYLNRHGRNGWSQLYSSFPKRARLPQLEDYPEPIAEELRRLQSPEALSESQAIAVMQEPSRCGVAHTIADALGAFCCAGIALFCVACFGTGLIIIISSWFS